MASIRHRPDKGGKWYVQYREGGRGSKNRSRVFATEAEAVAFKNEVEARADTKRRFGPDWEQPDYIQKHPEADIFAGNFKNLQSQGDSFVSYANNVIDMDDSLRPGTRALYHRILRLHFEGTELGASPIHTITPDVVAAWWRALPQTDANGVRRQAHQVLAKILNRALVVGDIDVSPLKRLPEIKRPRSTRPEIQPLSVDQVEALADAAAAGQWDGYSAARNALEIRVMAYAGLRAGEVGALKAKDILRDGDKCGIRVHQQVTRIKGGDARLADVKTAAGRRTVYIPCSLADKLAEFIAEHGPARDGRVFHGRKDALRYGHLINHSVASAAERIGMDVNAHQLRHTYASLLRRTGADARALQRAMGHADIRVTLQTYSHLFDDELPDLASRMEDLLGGGDK